MGWILQKADGSLIYLRFCHGGPGPRFQAWLGKNSGFASDFIIPFPTESPATPKSKAKSRSPLLLPALSCTLPDRSSSKVELRCRPRRNYPDLVGPMLEEDENILTEQDREASPLGSLEDSPRNKGKGDIDASLLTQRLGNQRSLFLSGDSNSR